MKEENSDDRELKSDSKEMCFVLRMLLVALESALKNTSTSSNYGLVSEKEYTPYQD